MADGVNRDAKKAYLMEYRIRNIDALRAYDRERYHKNKDARNAHNKVWRLKNKDAIKAKKREYYVRNRDAILVSKKAYRLKHSDSIKAKRKDWYLKNKSAVKAYRIKNKAAIRAGAVSRYRSSENVRIKVALSRRILKVLKGKSKTANTMDLLGCSIEKFKQHLSSRFQDGMSFDNHGYGTGKWHIDHIRPCASFDLAQPEQQRQCFHWSNIQPLWSEQNLSKSARTDWKNPVLCLN